jgi:predicted dehydrogenase
MTKPLGLAVVGLGWWGRLIVNVLKAESAVHVVAGCDARREAGEALAREEGFVHHATLDAVLQDPRVEAVALCTPHRGHLKEVLACAAAGKHVFCEKPLALRAADAHAAVQACQAARVVLAVGHERRFEPALQELHRLVERRSLGQVMHVEAHFSQNRFLKLPATDWRFDPEDSPIGPLTATGIHLVDLCTWLLGEPKAVTAHAARAASHLPNGDSFHATLHYPGQARATITALLATPFFSRIAVFGSRGWVEVRDKAHPEAPEGWALTVCTETEGQYSIDFPAMSPVLANLQAFVRAARGGTAYPVKPAEMVSTVRTLEALIGAAPLHRALPLP